MENVGNMYEQMWRRDGTCEKHSIENARNQAML